MEVWKLRARCPVPTKGEGESFTYLIGRKWSSTSIETWTILESPLVCALATVSNVRRSSICIVGLLQKLDDHTRFQEMGAFLGSLLVQIFLTCPDHIRGLISRNSKKHGTENQSQERENWPKHFDNLFLNSNWIVLLNYWFTGPIRSQFSLWVLMRLWRLLFQPILTLKISGLN